MSSSKPPNEPADLTARQAANRKNARLSTGPKTAAGRARIARNARRHGLSIPVLKDPALFQEIHALARMIAGANASTADYELAFNIAEARVDLVRVRTLRRGVQQQYLSDFDSSVAVGRDTERLKFLRYISEIKRAGGKVRRRIAASYSAPTGIDKLPALLGDMCKQLIAIDRYERRAISRLKCAIRAFKAP